MSKDKTLSPSKVSISSGQVDKLQEMLGHGLNKSQVLATSSTARIDQVIKSVGGRLRDDFVRSLEQEVQNLEAQERNTFTVIAKRVDYTRDPREAIRATGRVEYVNDEIAATMPRLREGIHENVEVVFFKLGRFVYTDELEREYEARGFVPDPYAQAAVNEEDPALADNYPNPTYWDRDGRVHSYLVFLRWYDERKVLCLRSGHDWYDRYWFAGVRKS